MRYSPTIPPSDIPRYVYDELSRIAVVLEQMQVERVNLIPQTAAPARPRNGDVVYADGTNWDPGSGAGLYQYRTLSWVLVG